MYLKEALIWSIKKRFFCFVFTQTVFRRIEYSSTAATCRWTMCWSHYSIWHISAEDVPAIEPRQQRRMTGYGCRGKIDQSFAVTEVGETTVKDSKMWLVCRWFESHWKRILNVCSWGERGSRLGTRHFSCTRSQGASSTLKLPPV